jgi:hypothetical protein
MFVPNKLRLDPSLATTVNSVSLHVDEARAAISQLGLDHHDATKDHVNALESKLSKCEKWVKGARGLSTSFGQADKSIEAATTFCGLLMDRLDVIEGTTKLNDVVTFPKGVKSDALTERVSVLETEIN